MKRISDAKRTCNLILGVGDGKVKDLAYNYALKYHPYSNTQINEFRGVEYSASTADFFTYDNLRPAEDWHPKIRDVVYWGMFSIATALYSQPACDMNNAIACDHVTTS